MNLVRIRSRAGFTQEGLAERADVSPRYLQSLESGRCSPTVHFASKLRRALACSWDDLLKGC